MNPPPPPPLVARYATPPGFDDLLMASSDGGATLTALHFDRSPTALPPSPAPAPDVPAFRETRRWLDLYFSGRSPSFSPPWRIENPTPFRRDVLQALLAVPWGAVTTYGAIAADLAARRGIPKMSAQAVGQAVGWNPICIIVPCHRVIGAGGAPVGYGGGLPNKLALLALERAAPPPAAPSPLDISLLSPAQADADPALRALYETSFPDEERIPWPDLLRLVRDMPLEFAAYRDAGELLGFTIVYPRPRLSWFWYFAVPPEKRGRGIGQRILSALLARYDGRSAILDMEDPAQPGAPNPQQRRRRAAFYLRNGFRETGVGRAYGPVAMTILLKGRDTFTPADLDQILSELFRLWHP